MTYEKTLELAVPLLLPGVKIGQDGYLAQLARSLQNKRGILRVHVKGKDEYRQMCLHYDAAVLSTKDVSRMARQAGEKIARHYRRDVIRLSGMDCSDCALVIEHGLARMDGVFDVRVSYPGKQLQVVYDSHLVSRKALEKRIRGLGYGVPETGAGRWMRENREVLLSFLGGLFLSIGWIGQRFGNFSPTAALVLYLAAYGSAGFHITRHALHALKERHFDTDILMLLAAAGAGFLGQFAEGALLLFLFSLGHALEERAMDKARRAITALADLAPKVALVRRDGQETELPVEQLRIGDWVIIPPGVRIPVDGKIVEGESGVDQSPVTGESMPVDKASGDIVFAGSVNGEGALEVVVTRLAQDTTLAKVVAMVENAQAQKSPTQRITERFERWFVPAVLVIDLLLIILPPLFGVPFAVSFMRAMTLLVATSPCALALGTPSAVLAGIARAARSGVLVKGGAHLENLGRIRAVAFDKTGTITKGTPALTDVVAVRPDGENDVLRLAAAVERRSAHPLALAVVRAAQMRGIAIPDANDAVAVTGRGMKAMVNDRPVWLGSAKMFADAGVTVPKMIGEQADALERAGKTTMLVGENGRIIGVIAVADVIRENARQAVSALKALGIRHMVMLTGDNPRVAKFIAGEAGLTDVRADLMPEDKLAVIDDLIGKYHYVAMAGDGVNDAPALANATLGIAMGGAGTDVALETADVVLMGDDLAKLPFAVGLGKAARRIIRMNLLIALGVIAGLTGLALTGLAGIGLAIVFHEGSTIVVVLNALRLLGYQSR